MAVLVSANDVKAGRRATTFATDSTLVARPLRSTFHPGQLASVRMAVMPASMLPYRSTKNTRNTAHNQTPPPTWRARTGQSQGFQLR